MAQGILLGRVTALCLALGAGGEFLNRRSEVRVLSGPPRLPPPPARFEARPGRRRIRT